MAILTPFRHRFWNNDGTLLAGGKVYIFAAGTTTPKDSYNSSTGLQPNSNPVILDSKGEADIWTAGLFKINVTSSTDVQVTGYPVDNLGQGQSSYDIAQYFKGKPTTSQELLRLPMVRTVNFDINMAGSRASARVAATASFTADIARNGTNFGTMVFAIGGTTATFVAATPPTFVATDVLTVTAPAGTDATLEDIGFILAGNVTP